MNQEQAKRNEIVSQLISILQKYNYTNRGTYFVSCSQMGVVSFCCDMVSRSVIRDMEEMGLNINHFWFNNDEHCYKISFYFKY